MPLNNWHTEIEAACSFWSDRMQEAIGLAYPEGSLMRPAYARLSHPANLLAFRECLFAEIEDRYNALKVEWNPAVPLQGAERRRIKIEGRFAHPSIYLAAAQCDLEDAVPFLPDGCETAINPGRVLCCRSRKHKPEVIEVTPLPVDEVMRRPGDGL